MDYSRIPDARDRARHAQIEQVRTMFGIAVEYDGVVLDPTKVVLHTRSGRDDDVIAMRAEMVQLRKLIKRAVIGRLPGAATFARYLHEITERIAAEFGHESALPPLWRDVDERNQALLLAVAQEMLMAWPMDDGMDDDEPEKPPAPVVSADDTVGATFFVANEPDC